MVIARKEKCWRIRLETGLARKRSQKFYKLIGMEPFALSVTLSLDREMLVSTELRHSLIREEIRKFEKVMVA
jgi:hypothetical protein